MIFCKKASSRYYFSGKVKIVKLDLTVDYDSEEKEGNILLANQIKY
jgi:hypothetical protein